MLHLTEMDAHLLNEVRACTLWACGLGSDAISRCRSPWKRLAEVAALVFVTASIWFLVTYWSPCAPLPDAARSFPDHIFSLLFCNVHYLGLASVLEPLCFCCQVGRAPRWRGLLPKRQNQCCFYIHFTHIAW